MHPISQHRHLNTKTKCLLLDHLHPVRLLAEKGVLIDIGEIFHEGDMSVKSCFTAKAYTCVTKAG